MSILIRANILLTLTTLGCSKLHTLNNENSQRNNQILQNYNPSPLKHVSAHALIINIKRLKQSKTEDVNDKLYFNDGLYLHKFSRYFQDYYKLLMDEIKSDDLVKSYIRSFIDYHIKDLNKLDNEYHTPLYAASSNGHLAMVRFLIERKAEVDKVNWCGETSLYAASSNGHLEIATFLIEKKSLCK
ncbi:MAG: ankyrin repeat domain-containing protein [Candidatus Cardinium sp.]|uniref:ankyrin repeat domain-containing protein n=1 Tax=Cardinium endosymbiont of Dermatophagoides farinae TaxID=2597823 RepID=UPI00118218C6|nr:ankyrin repeat domain-containing protein [Cardinium endosymbiont of Dermatophagoides farinae]TSJ81068.1 ankyrin repeat domain-containing protein [Cardinium endosymbiont of Dermatophagoides farinae]UWW97102.1 MAG: ankyrin repeat domain-containing protein [Candidatus Cardinium sp.]